MKPERFLWHLKREGFDHSHWWDSGSEIPRAAAVWEVLRRHPKAEHIEPGTDPLIWFIAEHRLKSWRLLEACQHGEWRQALSILPPQRGFDPRPVYSVTAESIDLQSGAHPAAVLTVDTKLEKQLFLEAQRIREQEIARLAAEHHRAGRVILAVNPDISNFEEAVAALAKCYEQHRTPADHGRGRVADWLNVIEAFERSELSRAAKQKRDKDLFLRYRRIISGVTW